jgi:hypothetical protein
MIKTIIAKGDQDYLYKLFETYLNVNDKREILKVSGKIIQKANKIAKKELIAVFDSIYESINKERKVIRNLLETSLEEKKKGESNPNPIGNEHIALYLNEYKLKLSKSLKEDIQKLIDDMKKGIEASKDDNVINILIIERGVYISLPQPC